MPSSHVQKRVSCGIAVGIRLLIIGSQVRALVRPPPQVAVPQRFLSFHTSAFCRDNFGVAPIWHRLGVPRKEHHPRYLPTSSYFVLKLFGSMARLRIPEYWN